jgi:cytochrome c2
MRVAALETTRAALFTAAAGARPPWRVLFETVPCLGPGVHRFAGPSLMGHETGGPLLRLGADSLLLATGHAGFDGRTLAGDPFPRDPAASWGKTILLSLRGRPASVFTSGHRNPQGLLRDAAGRVWLTEHGPRGGDELDLLEAGADYGWPDASLGTDYGSMRWPGDPVPPGLTGPVFAWVPSIAVSALLGVEDPAFAEWQGDLLAGSLTDRALHRVRLQGGRVLFSERVPLGRRVRALAEAAGKVAIWTDEWEVVTIRPNRGRTGPHLFALHCASCHAIADGRRHLIGPDLAGVVGRPIGSVGEPSDALRRLGGSWTPERLTAFLASPEGMVPGTSMSFPGLRSAAERSAIIEYLVSRR